MNKKEIIIKCLRDGMVRIKYQGDSFLLVRDWQDLVRAKEFAVPLCEFKTVNDFPRYLKIRKLFAGVFGNDISVKEIRRRDERESTSGL